MKYDSTFAKIICRFHSPCSYLLMHALSFALYVSLSLYSTYAHFVSHRISHLLFLSFSLYVSLSECLSLYFTSTLLPLSLFPSPFYGQFRSVIFCLYAFARNCVIRPEFSIRLFIYCLSSKSNCTSVT